MVYTVTRRKKVPETAVPQAIVVQLARLLAKSRANYDTEQELADWIGTSQPTINRFLSVLKDEDDVTKKGGKKKKQPFRPGSDIVATIAAKYGLNYDKLRAGMVRAGERGSTDMLPNRGRALDFLSDDYPRELLEALKRHPAPAGHEDWTPVQWAEYFVSLKKAWETGILELPGLSRA